MEIIEKQTIKEVPVDGNYGCGYGRKDINGKANAGLTLGIIGTALGAWALFGNRRSSIIGGLGTSGSGMLDGANININGLSTVGGDPLLGSSIIGNSLDEQLQMIERYKQNLEAAKQMKQQAQITQQPVTAQKLIWDDIDAEIEPLTNEQKSKLLQDEDYVETYTKIQNMVNSEILSLVKGRIENTPEGKELLSHQLKVVKRLKNKIIDETNREMEMFRKFREFSKQHPEVTYEEFIKANM